MKRIILIGGLPRCGKSTLAGHLIKTRHAHVYSTDILCETIGAAFPDLNLHIDMNPDEKIHLFTPILKKLIRTLSYHNGLFIVEGDTITPDIIKTTMEEYTQTVRGCILGSKVESSELKVRTGGSYDWISERSHTEIESIASYISERSIIYQEQCAKEGILYQEFSSPIEKIELEALALKLCS